MPRLVRPFLLWLPGIKLVSILDRNGAMSRLVKKMQLAWNLLQSAKVNIVVAVWCLKALFQFLLELAVFLHMFRWKSRREVVTDIVPCFVICPTLSWFTHCHRRKGHNLATICQLHSWLVRCNAVWKLIHFYQVSWQCWQKYICLPVGSSHFLCLLGSIIIAVEMAGRFSAVHFSWRKISSLFFLFVFF